MAYVVPHAGTWIEIYVQCKCNNIFASFPTRERGLKYIHINMLFNSTPSFPTRERGLKCQCSGTAPQIGTVVPHAGTWIEIRGLFGTLRGVLSFPTRERGLKYPICKLVVQLVDVVPHAGTWIEIINGIFQ